MNSVVVKDLFFNYEEDIPTIEGISFEIKKGEYVAILGHNGSGKSTIAKLIDGLLEKKSGQIFIDDLALNEENLYKIRSHIGIVFQNPDNQFIGSTVRDDIAFGLENKCVPYEQMDSIIEEYSSKVNMLEFLDHEPSKLSGGQKQRVAIAGILAMQPDILILDEATSMLDPKGKNEINTLVREIIAQNNMTVISITHDIEEAIYADKIILMNQGKVEMIGKPQEILMNETLLEKVGLEAPFIFQVTKKLNASGIKVNKQLQKEALVKELWQLHLNK